MKKMDILKLITALTAIITIMVNVYIFIYNNKHLIKVTNFELSGVKEILILEDDYYENQFTESFIHNFSSAYARFSAENHTNNDIEIYGFYLEIKLDNVSEPILVPLDAYTRREQQRIEVF